MIGVYYNWFEYAEACAWHDETNAYDPCPIYAYALLPITQERR